MTTLNRLSRNEILNKALDMASVGALDQHDRPNAPLLTNDAFAIDWLQEGIDWFHQQVPMAGILTSSSITIPASTGLVSLPTRFIVDMRDGVVITSPAPGYRVIRISAQEYVSRTALAAQSTQASSPSFYVVLPPSLYFVNRNGVGPEQAYTATLWFYQMPAVLAATTVPNFPSDLTLVEYVHLKALEWVRSAPIGSALEYAKARVAEIKKNGLFNEPEDYTIPFDTRTMLPMGGSAPWSWMGPDIS